MDQTMVRKNTQGVNTKDLVTTALLIALVFVATKFINFTLPISIKGGLVHAGNTMLFLAAILFGKRKGALAGAFGMGLFDLLSPWAVWAPFTFVVRGLMGYIIGHIAWMNDKQGNSTCLNITGIVVGGLWMMIGYYLSEVILYGNWIAPTTSFAGNLLQIVFGALVSIPLATAIKKTKAL